MLAIYESTMDASTGEIDEVIRKEIETLAQDALVGLEVLNSEHLEVTDGDLARMDLAFRQADA